MLAAVKAGASRYLQLRNRVELTGYAIERGLTDE